MAAEAIGRTDARTLTYSVQARTEPATVVFNDDAPFYNRLNRPNQSVKHNFGEYVRGMTHTNGIESLWSVLKRATAEQLRVIVRGEFANRLPYADVFRPKHTRQPALIKNWE